MDTQPAYLQQVTNAKTRKKVEAIFASKIDADRNAIELAAILIGFIQQLFIEDTKMDSRMLKYKVAKYNYDAWHNMILMAEIISKT